MRFPYPGISEWFLSLRWGEPGLQRVATHTGPLPRQPQWALCHLINQTWEQQVAHRSQPPCQVEPADVHATCPASEEEINQLASQGCQPALLPRWSTNCAVPATYATVMGQAFFLLQLSFHSSSRVLRPPETEQTSPVLFWAHPKQCWAGQAGFTQTSGRSEMNSVARASAVKADFSRMQRP